MGHEVCLTRSLPEMGAVTDRLLESKVPDMENVWSGSRLLPFVFCFSILAVVAVVGTRGSD